LSSDPALADLADQTASRAAGFVAAVEEVAAGDEPGAAVPILLLELSDLLATGAALGASPDIGRRDDVFPDPAAAGPGTEALRIGLAEQFGSLDEYADLIDPYVEGTVERHWLSTDLAAICADLLHGLALYTSTAPVAALRWWQLSYLSSWGPLASGCLRALQSLLAHLRLSGPIGAA
jgi:hypothetical protein